MSDNISIFGLVNFFLIKHPRQRLLFALVLTTITFTAVGAALFPILFSLGIDALATGDENVGVGVKFMVAFGVALTLVGVLEQVQWLTFGPMNLRLQRNLTTHAFKHALSLPHYSSKNYTTYEIGRTVERGLDAVREITSNLTFFLIPTLIELLIAAFVVAFMINVWIALVLFAALFAYGAIANLAAARIRKATETAMEAGIDAWTFGLDGVANAELVQQANMIPSVVNRLNSKLRTNDLAWAVTFRQRACFGAIQATIFGAVVLCVLWAGATDASTGTMSIGNLVLLNTYIIRLLQPVETFARIYREVHASLGEARMLLILLAVPVPDAKEPNTSPDETPFSLRFRDVTIEIGSRKILQAVSWALPRGSQLFIVGPSGVGKSSLLKVISCLSVAVEGDYLIDDIKVTEETAASLRSKIAVVQQDCLLFDWSISENIAFGMHASAEELDDVASKLGLDEVILRHQEQGNPTVGERGGRLSGGEKQRISLARALLAKPRLLVLDEPTAALDDTNRKRVLKSILDIQEKCTTVFVTHDLTLIEGESRVLFLMPSGQTCLGTHSDLLRRNPVYSRFVNGTLDDEPHQLAPGQPEEI